MSGQNVVCRWCGATRRQDEMVKAKRNSSGYAAHCKMCAASRTREWYQANNKARVYRNNLAWTAANPEKVAATRRRAWANVDQQAALARLTAWSKSHPEQARERTRRWREANLEWCRKLQRAQESLRRARLRAADTRQLSDRELQRMFTRQRGLCALPSCGANAQQLDHIIPIARGGRHAIGNLQYLCARCNQVKRDRLPIVVKAQAKRTTA